MVNMFNFSFSVKKSLFFNLFIIGVVTLILFGIYTSEIYNVKSSEVTNNEIDLHDYLVHYYLDKRKPWRTSNLGSLLFKFQNTNDIENYHVADKKFIVLVWKHYDWLKNRHIKRFNNKWEGDPLEGCSVRNCIVTGDEKYLNTADAVVVHLQKGLLPNLSNRTKAQRWIFLTDEAPPNTFSVTAKLDFKDLANVFNWSMSYRTDSDVPVPYGRTIPMPKQLLNDVSYKSLATLVPYWDSKRRDKLASVLMSNCGVSRRMEYLNELKEHLPLEIYGKCSKDHKNSCPGHFRSDCNVTTQYLFYLVLENSHCREYLTEKGFHFAYSKGAIPIIMGPRAEECKTILPPSSFLHVDNFDKPKDLADYIIHISKNDDELLKFHKWRNHFKIVNEHGYFGTKSFHYCRVCEALNYNDKSEKIYSEHDLRAFLDPTKLCF